MDNRSTLDTDNEYKFHPTDTACTSRTHIRITDDLKEWAKGKTNGQFFTSREMALGAAVAFAATYDERFEKFVFEQAYSADIQEMGLDEQTMSDQSKSDGNYTKENEDGTQDVRTGPDQRTRDVRDNPPEQFDG